MGRQVLTKTGCELDAADFDRLFEAYQSSLAIYCAREQEPFPSAEVRLAIVTSMIAEAERGEIDPARLAAAGLLAVGLPPTEAVRG